MATEDDKQKLLEKFGNARSKAKKEQGKKFRRTTFIEEFAEANSISSQTLYLWLKKRKDIGPEGLIDTRGKSGKNKRLIIERGLQPIMDPLIERGKPVAMIIKEFTGLCKGRNLNPPSVDTVRRYINEKLSGMGEEAVTEHKPGPVLITSADQFSGGRILPTGIFELDRVLGNGFYVPSTILFAGEPGIGKSTLMAQAAMAISKKCGPKSCLYFSTEQNCQQMAKRLIEIDPHPAIYVDDTVVVQMILAGLKESPFEFERR